MINTANPRFTHDLANLHILCSDLQRTSEQVMNMINEAYDRMYMQPQQQQIPAQEQSQNMFISPSYLQIQTGSVTPSQPPNF